MAKGIKEIHFEEDIVRYLVENGGFHELPSTEYDRDLCLIPKEVINFIKDTQIDSYNELKSNHYGDNTDTKILQNISKSWYESKEKTLDLFRNKIKDRGVYFDLVYFQPENDKTPEHNLWYNQNRLAVIRQLRYSKKNNNSIDIVLFVNGLPVITLELKNELTGQDHHNAIKQYIQDRDPKGEALFDFKRCIAHFAVGTQQIFLTTKLNGKKTFFLPFNKDLNNYNDKGFATAYLWEDVLKKDSLLDLLQNYINVQTDIVKEYDNVTKQLKEQKTTKLIFPRFHQRRAINKLLNAIREEGVGHNYLIQHSAGSGKSNTITWLAYRLAGFYRFADDSRALYDSVIIVNDRRVLDKQIQDNIRQLDKTPGLIAYIDENKTAQDLRKAIEEGKRIIITTLQKFPVISNVISSIPDRKYAVIIDEAHSSQAGESARHLKKTLSLHEAELEDVSYDLDDIVADEISKKGRQKNISFFAFTATPKPKTEELFGRLIDGKIRAFDSYSMEQAIKEGFICDVLKNYMSFKRYYKIIKKLDIIDKEYDRKRTIRLLNSYVDLQDHAIERKTRIMLEHFKSHTQNEIQGRARAMVVTRSRLHAVRFKRKFDQVMREMKLPYNALVAFSGTVRDDETDEEYTELSMNHLQGKISIAEALKLPQNRILIVANKFQTGFDEPLLHTMFVDKKLGGAATVQTLSRLNRTMRGKESTMVLDFVNDPEEVRADFQYYYGENYIEEDNQTDPNILYSLQRKIDNYQVFDSEDVESFSEIFFVKKKFEQLNPILRKISSSFENYLSQEEKIDFRYDVKSYIKNYRFLSQIISFSDLQLEKYFILLTSLFKMLPYIKIDLPLNVLGEVELESYKIQHEYTTSLELVSKDGELFGISPNTTLNTFENDEVDTLTNIINILNSTFGIDLTDEDKVEFKKMKDKIYSNEELMGFFNKNNSRDNIQGKFDEEIDNELLNFINGKLELYNKLSEDKVNIMFKNIWFNDLYDKKVRGL
jgi:type I restriction enzyme R subunit